MSTGTVRIAAIQATPVILDAEASVSKALHLLGEAAGEGVKLAVFPELFIPLYPSGVWAYQAARFDGFDEMWTRLWANSVDVPGPQIDRFIKECAEHDIYCVLGVNERESARPGSLYNTMILLGPEGLLWKHRKLMGTMHERLFHGVGYGQDLDVIETSVGRVGGLVCWENRMPLARYAIYRQGVQIWAAPTADDSDGWISTMSHIAIESGAFVVSAPQYIPRSAFPDDFPVQLPDDGQALGRGGAAIFEPLNGRAIAGPLYDQEGIVVADVDLGRSMTAKRIFDVVGHYSREDVLYPPAPTNHASDGPAFWPRTRPLLGN
ncbi:carbon-nitrogen hydrolase family protein [Arthrobacter sp. ZGTC131]|uniref:carbon-nitrogen hydrolase family protein n=1 Tax=Arthrobacter sp. ZGTC131 TaxID=2058898 RepID=UPI0015E47B40|nr:carbon-nitrogen hydrolase family protein [Arthrobacter sp. ZGTC131]